MTKFNEWYLNSIFKLKPPKVSMMGNELKVKIPRILQWNESFETLSCSTLLSVLSSKHDTNNCT